MNLPDRIAFTIFGMDIYWYAICITAGLLLAMIIASINAKKRHFNSDTAIDMCLWAVPIGIICARLYYVLFNLDYYKTFADIINIRNGGLAIPGGIIGGVLGLLIYSLIKKEKLWHFLDIAAPAVVIAQAIGRWGNFFNQEAYGPAVTNPKLLFFPFAVRIEDCAMDGCTVMGQHGHMATFFYEFLACAIIFIVLMIMFNRVKHVGDIFITYVMLYTVERAAIEQLRTDSLMLGSLKVTQILYIAVFIALLIFIVVRAILENKKQVVMGICLADDLSTRISDGDSVGSPDDDQNIFDDYDENSPCDNENQAEELTSQAEDTLQEPESDIENKE